MRTLFSYALLLDENGEEMHKSKGNSIPFDEAADQIGADVMRWMYAAANPATNLRFGYGPAHEVVRRFLLPLWNTYGFFVTYARLDGWTPDQTDGAPGARTLLDRWILSRLDAVVGEVRLALDGYDAMRATRTIESFVDDLSNWYVRRNRRRFWKGELDADKRAAYATLHEVLTTVCRLMAPITPHIADAMWENLVATVDATQPDSVHLTDAPAPTGLSDTAVEAAVGLARRTVALGRAARSASGLRTRQPLRAVRVKLPASARGALSPDAAVADELTREVIDELNVRSMELIGDESEMVERSLYPLLPVVGPRHGKAVGAVMAGARSGAWELREDGTVSVGGVTLQPDESMTGSRQRGWRARWRTGSRPCVAAPATRSVIACGWRWRRTPRPSSDWLRTATGWPRSCSRRRCCLRRGRPFPTPISARRQRSTGWRSSSRSLAPDPPRSARVRRWRPVPHATRH